MTAARLSLADVATLDLKVRPAGRHKRRDAAEGDGDLSARVNLIPQSGQQALTAAGRESARGAGGGQRHLISID